MKLSWSILAFAHADIWYGEEDIANITNVGGGYYDGSSDINWLFDNDYNTVFAGSPSNYNDTDKHLLVTFNVSFTTFKSRVKISSEFGFYLLSGHMTFIFRIRSIFKH